MPDLTEQILRQALAGLARPQLQPTLAADVLRLVGVRRQSLADSRRLRGARLLLAVYWLATSVASMWVIRTLPSPSWGPTALLGLALTMVPLGYAVFLWPRPPVRWAASCLKVLLADAGTER